MEAILQALSGQNGLLIAFLIIILVILVIVFAKKGVIKIHTDKVSVGDVSGDVERTIMRNQIEWAKLECEAFERKIPRFEGYDEYRGKFIIEKILDEIIKWIAFNHIEETKTYIDIKQSIVWNIVLKYAINDMMMSRSFKKEVDRQVEKVVKNLVRIRDEYINNYGE